MKQTGKALFDMLAKGSQASLAMIGSSLERMPGELAAEANRLRVQGGMETSSGINHGNNFFVPYGPGQYTPSPEHQRSQEHQQGRDY